MVNWVSQKNETRWDGCSERESARLQNGQRVYSKTCCSRISVWNTKEGIIIMQYREEWTDLTHTTCTRYTDVRMKQAMPFDQISNRYRIQETLFKQLLASNLVCRRNDRCVFMCGWANNIIAMAIYFAIVRCDAMRCISFHVELLCSMVEIYAIEQCHMIIIINTEAHNGADTQHTIHHIIFIKKERWQTHGQFSSLIKLYA